MNEQAKTNRGWRIMRRILIGVAVFATLIAIFYTEENWRGKRAWENCKRELEAKGAVLDWNKYIPPPIPDDQNFFTASTNILLRFVKQHDEAGGDAAARLQWLNLAILSSNGFPVLRFTNPLVVAEISMRLSASAATNDSLIKLNDATAGERIRSLLQAVVGQSANGSQGFKFSERQLAGLSPVKIVLVADAPQQAGDLANLIPPDLFTNIGHLVVGATGDPNSFQAKFDSGGVTAAADYLKWSDQFVPAFDEIRTALKRPCAIIPGDYSEPYQMPIPNFVTLRDLAQILAQRTQCYLLLGQSDKALHELTLMHDVCRILGKPPIGKPETVVEAMINVAITGLYVSTFQDGLRLQGWQEPQLAAIQAQLEGLNLLPFVADAYRMEQAAGIQFGTKDKVRKYLKNEFVTIFGTRTGWPDKIKGYACLLIPQGWIDQNVVVGASLMQKKIDCFDPADAQVFPKKLEQANTEVSSAMERPSIFHLLAEFTIPNLNKAWQTTAFNQTLANQAQIVCALERYKLANGNYPETLHALVPQFIQKIPNDIIGGQPLHYRRTDNGKFLLYSVGWNETDDGGITVKDKSGYEDRTKGDWVWKN
jgi:hypothetical protein